jgi:hypothetical protein
MWPARRARELVRADRLESRKAGRRRPLIRSIPGEGKSSRRLVRAPAGRRGPSHSAHRRCGRRGRAPTSCGERLPSPTWDEVTVNRSGGTTIESGGPSSGRDAARNVARPARRHRRLHSRRHQTGHRSELRTVLRADRYVAPSRLSLPVGQEGHEGGEVRFLGEANDVVVERHRCLVHSSWTRAEHAAHNTSIALTAGQADRDPAGPRRACSRPVATTNPEQSGQGIEGKAAEQRGGTPVMHLVGREPSTGGLGSEPTGGGGQQRDGPRAALALSGCEC